jgi:hypothetical protein
VTDEIVGAARGGDLQPAAQVPGGDPAQHRVDEPGRTRAGHVLGQVHRRGHGGVRGDPGGQQLVCPKPQHLAQRRVEPVELAV